MRRHTRIMSSAAALVAGVVFGVQPARPDENAAPVEEPRAGATAPAMAGRRRLDPEKSDDARQKMREAGAGRRGGAPGGKTTETFAGAPADKTLTITVRVEGTPMTLKRVYHLTDAAE